VISQLANVSGSFAAMLRSFVLLLALIALPALAAPLPAVVAVTGRGFVTDASHPKHPGDFFRADGDFRLTWDRERAEGVVEFESGEPGKRSTDRYLVRQGRVFQVDDTGREVAAQPLGDVSAATVAALHPLVVEDALLERRDAVRPDAGGGKAQLFAWNDELWQIERDRVGNLAALTRRVHDEVYGDGTEVVRWEGWRAGTPATPGKVTVTRRGRQIAALELGPPAAADSIRVPAGDRDRDRWRLAASTEVVPREIAPHLYAIDLDTLNTRVVIAEFADHLMVLEGAWNSRTCERIAAALRTRFRLPVRAFAFSHIHGQYVGGARAWVHEGATVIVPPTSAPLIEQIVKAPFDLMPDALSREPRPLKLQTVKDSLHVEDSVNAITVYNVPSGHTDEYFIFYFPRQKVLLAGDLFFYRPGKPLSGRAKQLCETVHRLGLDVRTLYATWPLNGYGTQSIVNGDELRQACGATP
jgi:glyoxylase-like metal-dependent hydrolase (beta-lactamase superfamily II)